MTLSSVIDPLRAANRLSSHPLFEWQLVSPTGDPVRLTCGIEIKVDQPLSGVERGNLLFIVAGFNNQHHFPRQSLPALKRIARRFDLLMGIEAGTWVMANAGIITNHHVTTHWEDLENFAFAFPALSVSSERYCIDRNVWTSGGASPALDMILHYLRTRHKQSLALDVASVFIYQESSASSNQSMLSMERLKRISPNLANAIVLMEENLEEPLPIAEIAQRIGLSQRTLENQSKRFLEVSPQAFYLRLRLQAARRLVTDSAISMLEIAVRSGFNNQSSFNRAFKKRFKQSPMQMRNLQQARFIRPLA